MLTPPTAHRTYSGKGSVCELIRSCLHENDRCVGTFTSPHIHTVRERIRVGDSLIPKEALVRHAAALQDAFDTNPWMLFFDKLLAVALLHFAEVIVGANDYVGLPVRVLRVEHTAYACSIYMRTSGATKFVGADIDVALRIAT